MSFLEECRKPEDEDGVGKAKAKGKIKISAATASSPTHSDAFAKQLKKQQQQLDTLSTGHGDHSTVTKGPGQIFISPGEPFIWNEG